MTTTTKNSISRWANFEYWGVILTLFSGLLLSIVSALNLCTEECSATKSYLFFNLPFAYFGLSFFVITLFLQVYSRKIPFLRMLLCAMIAGAIGAEVMFITIQKFQIKMWCPVCLSIATIVGLTALILTTRSFIEDQQRGNIMNTLKNILASIPLALLGFFIAMFAISKPDYALAAMNSMKDKIEFGNKESPIEIYFVTDWFCPICREAEPAIDKIFPHLTKVSGFFFIDMAVHPDSQNFSPYNIDFMANNKKHYLEIRNALNALSLKNKAPDDEAIKQAIAPLGEKLYELGYADIKAGLNFFDDIAQKYDIHGTPEMIILNTKTNDFKRLKGTSEITEARIMEEIDSLKKNS